MIRLLPYEKRLAEILGVSEEAYQEWKAITIRESIIRPAEGPVCGPAVPVLVNLAIAVGLTLLSSLLFPQRRQSKIITTRKGGSPTTSNQRSSPRFGFDSIPEPARVGQIIPIVIAKRENGLGGVRVAMPLVWSQVLALKGSQMARIIFMAGLANMASDAWDPRGWAIGNNTFGAYNYSGATVANAGRHSIYYAPNGGRINSSHLIAGRQANKDTGNFSNSGGQDVFAVSMGSGQYKQAFCMAEAPSTSTTFGLYGWCPNASMRRPAVVIQPTIIARISSSDTIRTDDDASALVELHKAKIIWSTRSALRQLNGTDYVSSTFGTSNQSVSVGDTLLYRLQDQSDAETIVRIDSSNSRVVDDDAAAQEAMSGIASSVAALQNSADSSLVPGELYRIGSCWAILEERISANPSESIFISDVEQEPAGGGNDMSYLFRVVKAGTVTFVGPGFINPPPLAGLQNGNIIRPPSHLPQNNIADETNGTEGRYKTCSQVGQIFRMAIASVGAVREFRDSEILIRSRVGISVNGMTGFREAPTIQQINARAGQAQVGRTANGVLAVSRYDSGGSEKNIKTVRYSPFVLEYSENRGETWTQFPEVFAVAGISGEEINNYLRTSFSSSKRWERRLVPLSSWEIRSSGLARIVVLDTNTGSEISTTAGPLTVATTGYVINPTSAKKRSIPQLEPPQDLGYGWSDPQYNSMFDGYARFAEAFPYENLQTSVGTAPEHEITQVNYYGDPNFIPSYESIALVGLNIAATQEIRSLQSFSGFCNNGYKMPRLLNGDTEGPTHLWPDWLREVMVSEKIGPFPRTQPAQIDRISFQEAAQWCQDREYFYDAVEDESLPILEWAADVALAHLLKLVRIGGVYHLQKAIEFDRPLEIKGQFNNGNIAEGSFKLNTIDYLARQPFAVQVKWREESSSAGAPLFARERVATVREVGVSANAPLKQLDLSKWCTNYKQAIDAACYYIRFTTIHDHQISFATSPDVLAAQLASGKHFILDLDVIDYSTSFQGFIQENGTIVSTRPWLLPAGDGQYQAITWDMESDPREETISVVNGLATPVSRFFAIRNSVTKPRTYEIEKINIDAEGVVTVEAFHHPADPSGYSLLGVNWATYQTDANWIIDL